MTFRLAKGIILDGTVLLIVAPETTISEEEIIMQRQTTLVKPHEVHHVWYVVDAAGKTPGRLSTEIAQVIMGKHKPNYTPTVDNGDYVIVINAKKIVFSGDKLNQKNYYNNSQYLGGLRTRPAKVMLEKYTSELIERIVWGMIPKGPLGRKMIKKLFVYEGDTHPHAAQNPQPLEFK